MGQENKSSIFLKDIELDEIIDEITCLNIKKSMGCDEIPPKIIKWAAQLFAPILQKIFTKCINSGHYPDSMKVAKVSPIYKKSDKNDSNNYRPISVMT